MYVWVLWHDPLSVLQQCSHATARVFSLSNCMALRKHCLLPCACLAETFTIALIVFLVSILYTKSAKSHEYQIFALNCSLGGLIHQVLLDISLMKECQSEISARNRSTFF